MQPSKSSAPGKKPGRNARRKRNRAAWILSGTLIAMMVLRLAAGILRPGGQRAASAPQPAAAGAAAAAPTAVSAQAQAESALSTFFALLAEGRFAEATAYYGGSYDALAAAYPADAASHARLLQDACTHGDVPCLPASHITAEASPQPDQFSFTARFTQSDGSLLAQTLADGRSRTSFPYSVARVNGRYLIEQLPFVPHAGEGTPSAGSS